MKKVLAAAMAVLVACSSLFGCSGQQTASSQDSESAAGRASATGTKNIYGWTVPEKTINIEFYAGQESPDDCKKYSEKMEEFLLKNFNVKMNKIVYDEDMSERLNLMLSSGDYPDCIVGMGWTDAQKWVDQGKALDLSSLVKQYGPNIQSNMGDYLKRYYSDDGKLYWLADQWGLTDWADYAPQVRWDWYNEIGSPDVSTPEAYYDALKAMVAKHPKNDKGEKTYALGMWKITNTNAEAFINTFGGMWGLKHGWKVDSSNNVKEWINTDEGLKMAEFVNQIYRDGLLDPDSFTMTMQEWGAKVSDQRYAGFVGSWWPTGTYGHEVWIDKIKDYNQNMRYVHVDVKASGVSQSAFNPKNTMGSAVILTDKCKAPEDYIRWFDFENTDLGTKLMAWGIPNEEESIWTLSDDGKWSFKEDKVKQITTDTATFNWDGIQKLGGQCEDLMTAGQGNMKDGSNIWFDQSNRDQWKQMKDKNLKDSIFDFTAMLCITIPSTDVLSSVNQQVTDVVLDGWAKAVMAKSQAECDAAIQNARTAAANAGIDSVENYYSEQYQANLKKFG